MKRLLFGLVIGFRAGNAAAYWYLRATRRRREADLIRTLRVVATAGPLEIPSWVNGDG